MIPWLVQLDLAVQSWIVLHRVSALDGPLLIVSAITRFGALWLVAGTALALTKHIRWGDLGRLALTLALGAVLTEYVLKPVIHRPRPFVTSPAVAVIGDRPGGSSFPSGQATSSFAGAVVLRRAAPALSIAWWVLAVSVVYSRVYLGVHYPLDVLAGAAIGGAIAALVLAVTSGDRRSSARRRSPT